MADDDASARPSPGDGTLTGEAGSPTGAGDRSEGETSTRWSRFSGLHTRTFEMELLLSGAVVFALVQLPPIVSQHLARFRAGLFGDVRLMGMYAEVYVTLVLYALIGAFVSHLVLRAFWIGLVGLESVYPQGIRWDKLEVGPNVAEGLRIRVPQLAVAIDRVDDLCSLIFSFGFLVVGVFVYSVALILSSLVIALAASHLLPGIQASTHFWVVLSVLMSIQVLPAVLDKRLAPRLDPAGLPARSIGRLVRIAFVLSPMRWIGTVQLTLQTHQTSTRVTLALIAAMLALAVLQTGGLLVAEGVLRFDRGGFFPAELREHGLDPQHYRDRRAPRAVLPKVPSIQSEVVEGPYLELSLPYLPRRQNPWVIQRCPDLRPLRGEGVALGSDDEVSPERVARAAACLGAVFEIHLDGQPVSDLHFDFGIEPGSGLEAVITRIPTRDLAPGRHELRVNLPPKDPPTTSPAPEAIRHVIPFWR